MRYAALLFFALLLGPAVTVCAKGFDGANAPGDQRVQGKWYNPAPQGEECCTAEADVQAIELGLDSTDPEIQKAADEALLKQLRGQMDE